MAVRQYIGARYVPRFSNVNNGIWSNIYSYEPLTIVKNGNDYYTSKQSVPVGIAITNTDYWVKTGDYNGAISDLQTRVGTLESDVDDVEGVVDTLGKLTKNKLKNVILIGDSWGTGVGSTQGRGWIYYLSNLINADNIYSNAFGGAGFCATGTGQSNKRFIDLYNELSIPAGIDIDTVIVAGGVNDATYSDSDIQNAIKSFADTILAAHPNADIKIYIINESLGASPSDRTYINGYMFGAGYLKRVSVSNKLHKVKITNYVNNLHCGDDGYVQIGRMLFCDLFGMDYTAGFAEKTVQYTNSDLNHSLYIKFTQQDDQIILSSTNFNIPQVSLTGTTEHSVTYTRVSSANNAVPAIPELRIPIALRLNYDAGTYSVKPDIQGWLTVTRDTVTVSWVPYNGIGTATYTSVYSGPLSQVLGSAW